LANPFFQGDIVVLDVEFIFTLEIEVKLTVYDETSTSPPTSSNPTDYSPSYTVLLATSLDNAIYTIVISVIQTKEIEEKMVVAIQEIKNTSEEVEDRQPQDLKPPDYRRTKKPTPYNNLDILNKPRILYMSFGIKIPEETLYIIIIASIYVYIKNLYKALVFQKVYEVYLNIWQDQSPIDIPIEQ
jgi:hypothetical protein